MLLAVYPIQYIQFFVVSSITPNSLNHCWIASFVGLEQTGPCRFEEAKGHKRTSIQPSRQTGSKSSQGIMSSQKSSKVSSHTTNTSNAALAGKRHTLRQGPVVAAGSSGKRLVMCSFNICFVCHEDNMCSLRMFLFFFFFKIRKKAQNS